MYLFIHLSAWLYGPLLVLGRFFSFLILYTVGRTSTTWRQPVARPLPAQRIAQIQNKRTQTSMPQVGFVSTISLFERARTDQDRAATVIGNTSLHFAANVVWPSSYAVKCRYAQEDKTMCLSWGLFWNLKHFGTNVKSCLMY
jgi:hypothetical protein